MTLEERIKRYMAEVEPAVSGQNGHGSAFWAARVLVRRFGLSPEQAWPFIVEYNARCKPPWSQAELRHKLDQALNASSDPRPRGYLLDDNKELAQTNLALREPEPKPQYQPDKLQELASKIEHAITPEWLEAHSKFTCWNRSPAGFLHKLYRLGEHIVVFKVFESQGCDVWEHPGITGDLSTLDHLQPGCPEGVWFTINPVDGEFHWNPRDKKESRRSEESVVSWRYLVVESDNAPADLWLKVLVQLPLRISAIYSSGGSSIHALVRVDAESKAAWDEIVRRKLAPILVPLGADPRAMTAVRLSRLPNCIRGETKQLQRLLYINDHPDKTPIYNSPLRSELTEADYAR